MFTNNGCSACHSLGTNPIVGPGLSGVYERSRTISGELTPDEYLVEAIIDPKAYIVDGFDDSMPSFEHLSEEEIADLVSFLKTVGIEDDRPLPVISDIPAEVADELPELENPDAMEDVAQWLARSMLAETAMIAPSDESEWLGELLDQPIFSLTQDGQEDAQSRLETVYARAMVLSTLSLANERFFVFYTGETTVVDQSMPRDPWISVNHNGRYVSSLRMPPAITAVLSEDGEKLATLANLAPVGTPRITMYGGAITVETIWEGERDGEVVQYSRSLSMSENGSTLTVIDEVDTALNVSGIRIPIWPAPGAVLNERPVSGDTVSFVFDAGSDDSYVMEVKVTADSLSFEGDINSLEVKTSSKRMQLEFKFDRTIEPQMSPVLLDPRELVSERSIGSVLLKRSPALESRISRLARAGFEIAFEATPYVVLAHPDFLDPNADSTVTPVQHGSETMPALGIELAFEWLSEGALGDRPLWLSPIPDGSGRSVVIDQDGKILIIPISPESGPLDVFVDLTDKVDREGGERGLLGLAFHPEYEINGLLYLAYSSPSPRRSIISEFRRSLDGDSIDLSSERVILDLHKDKLVHNGGTIAFGPDGYLYISLGDDEFGSRAQDLSNLYGTILRVDVDGVTGDLPYAIPSDNPFVSDPDQRDEIWAYGLRNPWRFSFDRLDGTLWAGDVGNRNWEEIDLIEPGKNYGWLTMEGSNCFRPETDCDTSGLTLPVYEYSHNLGCAVVGGYVYRGSALPELQGAYIFGDYCTGRIWGLRYDHETNKVTDSAELAQVSIRIASFAEDENGEIYVVGFSSAGVGNIFRLTAE